MVSYLVASIPWTLGFLALSPPNPRAIKYRKIGAGTWVAIIAPLTYYFLQHKIHRVPGGKKTLQHKGEQVLTLESVHDLRILGMDPRSGRCRI
jgi:hypothetical protein